MPFPGVYPVVARRDRKWSCEEVVSSRLRSEGEIWARVSERGERWERGAMVEMYARVKRRA